MTTIILIILCIAFFPIVIGLVAMACVGIVYIGACAAILGVIYLLWLAHPLLGIAAIIGFCIFGNKYGDKKEVAPPPTYIDPYSIPRKECQDESDDWDDTYFQTRKSRNNGAYE